MQIQRSGDQPSARGPADWFTGTVRIDPLFSPPHWHDAAPGTAMSHIALQEQLDGRAVEWLEQVNDAQYAGEA